MTAPAPGPRTPRLAFTLDALDRTFATDDGPATGRALLLARSHALGRYVDPSLRERSNIVVRPSATEETFTLENGAEGVVFHQCVDFPTDARTVAALLALDADHLVTADPVLAAAARAAGLPTTLAAGRANDGNPRAANGDARPTDAAARPPVRILCTPDALAGDADALTTAGFLRAHARARPRAYALTVSQASSDAEHLRALVANPPDLFLTPSYDLAARALRHGVLAGVPARTPLHPDFARATDEPLTWVFDFDGVTIDRESEAALLRSMERDPRYGAADAWASEGRRATTRNPGPAMRLLARLAEDFARADGTGDPVEILTSRPYFAAGTVRATLDHHGIAVSGIAVIDEGSKGAQLARIRGILLDDSGYKIRDVRAYGRPAVHVPTIEDAAYAIFRESRMTPQAK